MRSRTILTLVRHGETAANTDGVWHGSIDTPLSLRGRQQAERVAAWLAQHQRDAAALYTSPLQRALHTAEVIGAALGLAPRVERDLREFELGDWEGKSFADLHNVHRLWHSMRSDPDFAPHGGESPRQVTARFAQALRRIEAEHPRERVVVVAHGGALSLALGELLDGDYTQWRRVMNNCAVSEIELRPVPLLVRFNHTDHLDDL